MGNNAYVPENGGFQEIITVADPAIGTDWNYEIPAGFEYVIETVAFNLTTAGGGANRQMRMSITILGVLEAWRLQFTTSFASGATACVSLAMGSQRADDFTNDTWADSMPDMRMIEGMRIESAIISLGAGDQIADIRMSAKRWKVQP
jgi:hypothetical protein